MRTVVRIVSPCWAAAVDARAKATITADFICTLSFGTCKESGLVFSGLGSQNQKAGARFPSLPLFLILMTQNHSTLQQIPRGCSCLAGVELNQRRGIHREGDVCLHRCPDHAARELVRRIQRDVARQSQLRTALHSLHDRNALARLARRHGDFVTRLGEIARPVHLLAVDADVAVRHELARRGNRRRKAHAEDDVVEPTLEHSKEVVAGAARHLSREREIATQLALAHAVVETNLLLLLEQTSELARLPALGL